MLTYFWRDFGKSNQKSYRDFGRDWEINLEPGYGLFDAIKDDAS